MPSFRTIAQTVALAAIFAQAAVADKIPVHTFSDSGCSKEITPTWESSGDTESGVITMDSTLHGWPLPLMLSDVSFPGRNTSSSGLYFNFPKPGTQCRYVVMQDYTQQNYGLLGFTAPYGEVILNVDSAGCYYAPVTQGNQNLYFSFCCGTDCKNYDGGYDTISTRDLSGIEAPERPSTAKSKRDEGESKVSAHHGSLAGRAALLARGESADKVSRDDENEWAKCNYTVLQEPTISVAGRQVALSGSQSCPGSSACSIATTNSVTVTHTLTTSKTQTITNQAGASVAIKAGVDFFAVAEVTTTLSYQFSDAIATGTMTSDSNSTTVSVTNTLTQMPGTNAFFSYTPTYFCTVFTVDCGSGASAPLTRCAPGPSTDGHSLLTYIS